MNRSKDDIKAFIHKHWELMSDTQMYEQMIKHNLKPTSIVAVTRMRQREGLIRDNENMRKFMLRAGRGDYV